MVICHPLDLVYFQLDYLADGKFKSCLNIHPDALKKVTNITDATQKDVEPFTLFSLEADGKLCQSQLVEATFLPIDTRLCNQIKCSANAAQNYLLKFEMLDKMDPTFSVIGQFKDRNQSHAFTVNQKNKIYELATKETNFLHLGIEHIGATPAAWKNAEGEFAIADGIDHVLFVVVLVLMSVSWRALLLNVSGFTLGHSITLGLALAGVVVVPAVYIEPAIAASIAYLAFKAFRNSPPKNEFWLTIFFGFLHGMGFSYVLGGLKFENTIDFLKVLALFNVGIELGQLIIILLLVPVFLVKNSSWRYATVIKQAIGLIIFCFSLYWVFQRVLLLGQHQF